MGKFYFCTRNWGKIERDLSLLSLSQEQLHFLEVSGEIFLLFLESQKAFIKIWADRCGSDPNHVYGYLSLGSPGRPWDWHLISRQLCRLMLKYLQGSEELRQRREGNPTFVTGYTWATMAQYQGLPPGGSEEHTSELSQLSGEKLG